MSEANGELAVMEKTSGQLIQVTETEFKGFELVDVREYFRDSEGVLRPTRKGLALRREDFGRFVATLIEAEEKLQGASGGDR